MPVSFDTDPRMRRLAWEALTERVGWFEWLRMKDADKVATEFLKDWRDAIYRHATQGLTLWDWTKVWGNDNQAKYQAKFPYLKE